MALTIREMQGEVQRNLETRVDYDFGRHSWHSLYLLTTPKEKIDFPYTIKAFRNYLHVADPYKIRPFNPKGRSVSKFKNTVSASFSYAKRPVSIMISDGRVIHEQSCHAWLGQPESVLWFTKNGERGITQCITVDDLPHKPEEYLWAIGGAGLKSGDAKKEGFIGRYSDVWRRTSHIVIGFDKFGYFNVVEVINDNKTGILSLIKKMGLRDCVLLDGGHVTASNIDGHTRNQYQAQYYAIQLG